MGVTRGEYAFYKSKQICPHCKKEKAITGQVLCPSCAERNLIRAFNRKRTDEDREKARKYVKSRREDFRARGLCSCGRTILKKKYKTCERCREIARSKYIPKISSHDICTRCNEPTYGNTKLCKYHYDKAKEHIEKQRETGNYRNFKKEF